jgi:hypothetical protein
VIGVLLTMKDGMKDGIGRGLPNAGASAADGWGHRDSGTDHSARSSTNHRQTPCIYEYCGKDGRLDISDGVFPAWLLLDVVICLYHTAINTLDMQWCPILTRTGLMSSYLLCDAAC